MTPCFLIYGLVASGILICFLGDTTLRRVSQVLDCVVILFALALFASLRSPNVDRNFQNYALWFSLKLEGNARIFYVTFLAIVGFGLFSKSLAYVQPYSVFREWDARLALPFDGAKQSYDPQLGPPFPVSSGGKKL